MESVFLSILWNEIIIYFNDIAGLFEDVVDLYIFVNTIIKSFKSYVQGWRDQFGVIEFKQSLHSEKANFRHGKGSVKLWSICRMGFQGNAGEAVLQGWEKTEGKMYCPVLIVWLIVQHKESKHIKIVKKLSDTCVREITEGCEIFLYYSWGKVYLVSECN